MFSIRPRPLRLPRFARLLLLLTLVVVLLCSCQAKVSVDAKVNRDGSGTVAVGVGLDDAALKHAGDLDAEARLDDLAAAGWTVTKATKEADGLTWLRATKPFTSPQELDAVMAEIAGANGMFRGFALDRTETETDITYRLRGTADGSKGVAQFSDPELTARLGGDPFGGFVKKVETAEGKPAADMVSFDVTVSLGAAPAKTYHPTLKDTAATPIEVVDVEAKPPPAVQTLGVFVVGAGIAAVITAMLVLVRKRFRHAPSA